MYTNLYVLCAVCFAMGTCGYLYFGFKYVKEVKSREK